MSAKFAKPRTPRWEHSSDVRYVRTVINDSIEKMALEKGRLILHQLWRLPLPDRVLGNPANVPSVHVAFVQHCTALPVSTHLSFMISRTTLSVLAFSVLSSFSGFAQDDCEKRTFITTTSFTLSGFMVLTYGDESLDSLFWDFGDGVVEWQTEGVGTGSATHEYAAPGTYTVTLERWGRRGVFGQEVPFYCINSIINEVYDQPTDSLCGGDFLTFVEGTTVTFSNRSVIHAPGFNSHSSQPLWDFGNGETGDFINRIYEVEYAPGSYTACLYYGGFSFNDGGYSYDCATCNSFIVTDAQSVENHVVKSFAVYPNPAGEWLDLSGTLPISTADLQVVDHVGRALPISRSAISGTAIRLDVSDLATGSYFVLITVDGGVRTLPFLKQ